MSTEREKIAQELATKDGKVFENLDPIYHNAYLHNADGVIAEREATERAKYQVKDHGIVPEVKNKYDCNDCKDTGFVQLHGDSVPRACPRCGNRKADVLTQDRLAEGMESLRNQKPTPPLTMSLTMSQLEEIENAPPIDTVNYPPIGPKVGNGGPEEPAESKPKAPRQLLKGEYRCLKCKTPHRLTSKQGEKHQIFAEV